jgi:hypothetical protein
LDVDYSLSHGIVPVASTEPSYVAVTIFASRASFEAAARLTSLLALPDKTSPSPETVFYEGTLVISNGTSYKLVGKAFDTRASDGAMCFSRSGWPMNASKYRIKAAQF